MSLPVRLSTFATARIEEILDWYAKIFDEEMAADFSETLTDKFEMLEKFNRAGPEVVGQPGVHRLIIQGRFNYYIFYRIAPTEVVILALTKNAEPELQG